MNEAIIADSLIGSDLDWSIELAPILVKGKPSAYFNIIRGDNKRVLGNCTAKYKLKQNADFVSETLQHAAKNGFKIHSHESGVVDKDGKQIFVRFKTKESIAVGKDQVEESVTVVRHHDGRSLANQSFCTYIIQTDNLSFNLPMITSQRLKEAACLKCSAAILKRLRSMSNEKVTADRVKEIVDKLINPKNENMSSRRSAAHSRLTDSIIDMKAHTAWDVFKGVVNYSEMIKTSKDRKASMFFGTSAKIVESAFELLSSNTK